MLVKEVFKKLVTASNYAQARITVHDSFIEFMKENMPSQYYLIKEKEEIYQSYIKLLKKLNQSKP
jgi:hypothetical protein